MTRAAPPCTFHNDGFAPASEQCLDDCGVVSKRRRHVQGRRASPVSGVHVDSHKQCFDVRKISTTNARQSTYRIVQGRFLGAELEHLPAVHVQ